MNKMRISPAMSTDMMGMMEQERGKKKAKPKAKAAKKGAPAKGKKKAKPKGAMGTKARMRGKEVMNTFGM
jgi:hypothetical protein